MAEALIGGLLEARALEIADLWATDPMAERRELMKRRFGIKVGIDNKEAAGWADVVLLAVKPQSLDGVVDELAPVLAGRLVISIAAGVPLKRIADRLSGNTRLIRAMPNAPAMVRQGMSVLAIGPGASEEDRQLGQALFEAVGRVSVVEERLMQAVTGLSGSGPAYGYMIIEAMADGGVKMGLPRQVAQLLAAQTLEGAARMVLETGEHPARLKDSVASPGGTTIAGLQELEQGGLRATLIAAVEAATRRSEELGK